MGPKDDEAGAIGAALGVTGMRDNQDSETFSSAAVSGEMWF